jgi:hypothetical protein
MIVRRQMVCWWSSADRWSVDVRERDQRFFQLEYRFTVQLFSLYFLFKAIFFNHKEKKKELKTKKILRLITNRDPMIILVTKEILLLYHLKITAIRFIISKLQLRDTNYWIYLSLSKEKKHWPKTNFMHKIL